MDQLRSDFSFTGSGLNIPCKVSIINEKGEIVLDTLIQPCVAGVNYPNVGDDLEGYKSLESIHGIKPEWLRDAPSFADVRDHIMELCGKKRPKNEISEDDETQPKKESIENQDEEEYQWIDLETYDPELHSTFIGHGVTLDLKVMGIGGVPFLCTQNIDKDPLLHQSKKLKTLSEKYLNAKIQEGHHSSIIDARACLALFLRLKGVMGLELDGPMFLGATGEFGSCQRRSRRKGGSTTFSKVVNRLAFKSLENVENQALPTNHDINQYRKESEE